MKNPPQCGSCNCDAQHRNAYRKWVIADVEYDTCPRYLISDQSAFLLQLYANYRRGVLPYSGGLFDQPHRFVEAMHLIENEAYDDPGDV